MLMLVLPGSRWAVTHEKEEEKFQKEAELMAAALQLITQTPRAGVLVCVWGRV